MIATWAVALLLLPLTTPAFLPFGHSLVRPPALLLLGLVAVGALLHGPSRSRVLSDTGVRLLLVFAGWAMCVGAWHALHPSPGTAKGMVASGLFLRAGLTLAGGAACYIAARSMLGNPSDLRRWWPYILCGLLLSVLWAFIQRLAYTETGQATLGPLVSHASKLLSGSIEPPIDCSLADARPHGLAYEPSWLASQLLLLLMPVGFCWLMLENGRLRAWGGLAIYGVFVGVSLGSSRLGYAIALTSGCAGVLWGFLAHSRRSAVTAAHMCLCLILGAVLAWRSTYFKAALCAEQAPFDVPSSSPAWPGTDAQFAWAVRSNFIPRMAAAHAAATMASASPITGVGLGAYPIRFPECAPAYALYSSEVRGWADPDPAVGRMPNAKNMLLRIAAETGLIGLALWLAFIAWHWSRGWSDPAWRLLAILAAIALLADWISLDSFALPQAWLLLAIVVACRPEEHPA